MTVVSRFCYCFDLRTGAIFSGVYALVLCSIFLTKHAVWLRLLLVGEVDDSLEPFLDSLLRDRNDTWNPTALNLTAKLLRRNLASHTLHLLWISGGFVASVILLVAIFKKLPILFLPWLSWCSVNGIILLVNAVVDILIWVYFRLYSSMTLITVYGYANLPFMIYLLFVTASYYRTIESMYEGNKCRCWPKGFCKGLCRKGSDEPLGECQSFPTGDGDRSSNYGSTENRLDALQGLKDTVEREEEINANEKKDGRKSVSLSGRKDKGRKKFKPPKIRISQPSTDSDW